MRYMMLVYESQADLERRENPAGDPYVAAWRAYHKALVEAGVHVTGAPLTQSATATTVRLRDGRRQVQDGPFAEAKEELGGFVILELPSLDTALDWATRCPAAARGRVEIRPIDTAVHDAVLRA
jgi:hypothetical protein